jgi:hypothetical protein
VAGSAINSGGITACTLVELKYVVVRLWPAQLTVEVGMNPLPLTVSVKPSLPLNTEVGEIAVTAGAGFGGGL